MCLRKYAGRLDSQGQMIRCHDSINLVFILFDNISSVRLPYPAFLHALQGSKQAFVMALLDTKCTVTRFGSSGRGCVRFHISWLFFALTLCCLYRLEPRPTIPATRQVGEIPRVCNRDPLALEDGEQTCVYIRSSPRGRQ